MIFIQVDLVIQMDDKEGVFIQKRFIKTQDLSIPNRSSSGPKCVKGLSVTQQYHEDSCIVFAPEDDQRSKGFVL